MQRKQLMNREPPPVSPVHGDPHVDETDDTLQPDIEVNLEEEQNDETVPSYCGSALPFANEPTETHSVERVFSNPTSHHFTLQNNSSPAQFQSSCRENFSDIGIPLVGIKRCRPSDDQNHTARKIQRTDEGHFPLSSLATSQTSTAERQRNDFRHLPLPQDIEYGFGFLPANGHDLDMYSDKDENFDSDMSSDEGQDFDFS